MTNTVSETISDETLDSIIQIESGGNPLAKASTSSALGLGQFLNATWLGIIRKHAPYLMRGRTDAQILALRTDPNLSIEMLARFTEDNVAAMGGGGPGDIYLAHFLGVVTAKKFFRASPSAKVDTLVTPDAIRANRSILENKTVKQVRDWADSKMKKSGGHGWVKKYYKDDRTAQKQVMTSADLGLPENFRGDLQLFELQRQLKTMNYYGGLVDGLWGGKTSGAIAGFLNDRRVSGIPAPTSLAIYQSYAQQLSEVVNAAEAEGYVRPVSAARAEANPQTLAEVAPEIKPANTGFAASASAAVGGFALSAWQLLGSYATTVWDFFTQNKDNIPPAATDPTFLQKVPAGLWLFAGTLFFCFLAYNAYKVSNKIRNDVQDGIR